MGGGTACPASIMLMRCERNVSRVIGVGLPINKDVEWPAQVGRLALVKGLPPDVKELAQA